MNTPLCHLFDQYEYDDAAEMCALSFLDGIEGSILSKCTKEGALKLIKANPKAFKIRVVQMAYWIATMRDEPEMCSNPVCRGKGKWEAIGNGVTVCHECFCR